MQKMSSITFPDGSSYEVTDDKARKDIVDINNNANNMQGAIDEVKRTLGYTVTSKNLLPYPYYNTTLQSQSTHFTDNGDGTVTINGTATGDAIFQLKHREHDYLTLKTDSYTVTGVPKNSNGVQIRVLNSDGEIIAVDEGNGANLTINETENIGSYIFVASGTTVNNLVLKPMISKEGGEYEPYEADLYTRLEHYDYLNIKDKITVTGNCTINQAFVKNGNVFINGNIKGSVSTGVLNLFTLPNGYAPQYSIGANVFSYNNVADLSKIANVVITPSNRTATAWVTGSLSGNTDFNFIYALI